MGRDGGEQLEGLPLATGFILPLILSLKRLNEDVSEEEEEGNLFFQGKMEKD